MSTSQGGVDTHEMVLIHRVIRREFGQLPRLFRSAANDRARSKVVGAHAKEMLHFLHTHHTGEDELLFPLLRQRTALDPELMDRMDAQHAQVNDAVAAVRCGPAGVDTSADTAAGERMAARIDAMMPTLIEHLAEEEQTLLPIVSVTLTQREWDALGKHGMSAIPAHPAAGHPRPHHRGNGRRRTAEVPAGRAGASSPGLQADRPPAVQPRNQEDPRLTPLHSGPQPSPSVDL